MPLTREDAMNALRNVQDPELFKDIVSLGMVKELEVDGDRVDVTVELTTPACPMKDEIENRVVRALAAAGAEDVNVSLTADVRGGRAPGAAGEGAQSAVPGQDGVDPPLPQVKNIIAVGAGKGGVGKSTVAINLAVGLQRTGAKVGLMDGDIYGPSMPTMLGVKGVVPKVSDDKKRILPHHVHGIHAVTIGSLVEEDKPLMWRGPMAHGAFKQLILDNTKWPDLDYLIVDLPPGTGDVPLTLCQILPLTGAVVVATPQQVALDDATRAVKMFEQLGCPVLGLVENMSYFVDEQGVEHDIFGRGGSRKMAETLGLPIVAEIPMLPQLRINSDTGKPHANFEAGGVLGGALEDMTGRIAGEVAKRVAQPSGPQLNIT
ncbi:MAG: Mrp/NBP35 family ATP-binding protein [Planctomycetota bacterium]